MDKEIHGSKDAKFIPMTSIASRTGREVTNDVFYYTDQIVNIVFLGDPKDNYWYLIDAGLPFSAEEIIKVASERFGEGSRPEAIILTHGHFDHVGGLIDLVKKWQVPVYAHPLEFPYLTGEERYPNPDWSVEGGLLAKISPMYPVEPIQLGRALRALPEDGEVPGLSQWRWIHTPGHSPGHVSFFREKDRVLVSGDAFITVRQDSFYNVLMQTPEINGPPRYLTTDWEAAWKSVENLFLLNPRLVVPGHGVALEGIDLKEQLKELVEKFDEIAIPDFGKYVDEPEKGYEH